MTPRVPLAATLLGAALLSSPASAAAVRPGTWSGYGSAGTSTANLSGSVAFTDGATSFCSVRVIGLDGWVSCSGGVAFATSCLASATPVSVALACVETGRNLYVEVAAAVLPTGRFAGTITYERL